MDWQMAWNRWAVTLSFVHFAERIGGKLATFTVINLIANISYALVTVALPFFPNVQLCVAMAFRCSACNFREAQEKGTDVGESSSCSASTVREPESSDQNL